MAWRRFQTPSTSARKAAGSPCPKEESRIVPIDDAWGSSSCGSTLTVTWMALRLVRLGMEGVTPWLCRLSPAGGCARHDRSLSWDMIRVKYDTKSHSRISHEPDTAATAQSPAALADVVHHRVSVRVVREVVRAAPPNRALLPAEPPSQRRHRAPPTRNPRQPTKVRALDRRPTSRPFSGPRDRARPYRLDREAGGGRGPTAGSSVARGGWRARGRSSLRPKHHAPQASGSEA